MNLSALAVAPAPAPAPSATPAGAPAAAEGEAPSFAQQLRQAASRDDTARPAAARAFKPTPQDLAQMAARHGDPALRNAQPVKPDEAAVPVAEALAEESGVGPVDDDGGGDTPAAATPDPVLLAAGLLPAPPAAPPTAPRAMAAPGAPADAARGIEATDRKTPAPATPGPQPGAQPGAADAAAPAPAAAPQKDRAAAAPPAADATPFVLPQAPVAAAPVAPPAPAPTLTHGADARIAAPVMSDDFAPAIGAQVSLLVREGVQEARLQLNPAEMGPITVQIQIDGSSAQVTMTAEHALTRERLEQALPALAVGLQDNGLTLTGGGVFEQQPRQPGQDLPTPRGSRGSPGAHPGDPGVEETARRAARTPAPRGVVDLYA